MMSFKKIVPREWGNILPLERLTATETNKISKANLPEIHPCSTIKPHTHTHTNLSGSFANRLKDTVKKKKKRKKTHY